MLFSEWALAVLNPGDKAHSLGKLDGGISLTCYMSQ